MARNGTHTMRNLIRTANRLGDLRSASLVREMPENAGLLFGGNRHLIPIKRLLKIGKNIIDAFKTG